MRYMSIDEVSFRTVYGTSFSIKDLREYPTDYQKMMSVSLTNSQTIDEISSRRDIYGEGGEMDSYKIVDFNIVKLYEAGFNLSKLRNLDVPDNG